MECSDDVLTAFASTPTDITSVLEAAQELAGRGGVFCVKHVDASCEAAGDIGTSLSDIVPSMEKQSLENANLSIVQPPNHAQYRKKHIR